jgi:ubiquinone/menaquinone biosynthesis C-methylase UbiE
MDALNLREGERVLDVGCGVGAATLRAADTVGVHGAVTGVDISPACIARARLRARSVAQARVSFQVADAQTADLTGGPFDAAMSQFGVLFFADPVAAFANVRRHLVPGGRLCFTCWRAATANPWSFAATLADMLPPAASPSAQPAPGPFSLAEEGRVREVLHAAGFRRVDIRAHRRRPGIPEDTIVDDVELALMGVPVHRLAEARARVSAHLAPHRQRGDVLRMPLWFSVVTAR